MWLYQRQSSPTLDGDPSERTATRRGFILPVRGPFGFVGVQESEISMPTETKTPEQYVCPNCFNDEALQGVARAHAVRNECGFCDSRSNAFQSQRHCMFSSPLFETASNHATRRTLAEEVEFDDEGRPLLGSCTLRFSCWGECRLASPRRSAARFGMQNSLKRSSGARTTSEWYPLTLTSPKCPYLALADADLGGFCLRITEKARFFFFVPIRGDAALAEPDQFPTVAILDELANLIRLATDLVKTILRRVPRHFRATAEHGWKQLTGYLIPPIRITPPPSASIRSNRMSPAGIVMFYGAVEKETALSETYDSDGEEMLTVAAFRTLQPFKIIDLTHLPTVPSIYDPEQHQIRTGIQFLHSFAEQVAVPVVRDRREHVAYVPTQVVARSISGTSSETKMATTMTTRYEVSYTQAPVRGVEPAACSSLRQINGRETSVQTGWGAMFLAARRRSLDGTLQHYGCSQLSLEPLMYLSL